jgi:hypothetical protein
MRADKIPSEGPRTRAGPRRYSGAPEPPGRERRHGSQPEFRSRGHASPTGGGYAAAIRRMPWPLPPAEANANGAGVRSTGTRSPAQRRATRNAALPPAPPQTTPASLSYASGVIECTKPADGRRHRDRDRRLRAAVLNEPLGNLRSDQAKQDRDREEQPFRSLVPRVGLFRLRRVRLGIVLLVRLHPPSYTKQAPGKPQDARPPSPLLRRTRASVENPVTFQPGLARLSTRPAASGSPTAPATIGIVVVACLRASGAAVPSSRKTSTFLSQGRGSLSREAAEP